MKAKAKRILPDKPVVKCYYDETKKDVNEVLIKAFIDYIKNSLKNKK